MLRRRTSHSVITVKYKISIITCGNVNIKILIITCILSCTSTPTIEEGQTHQDSENPFVVICALSELTQVIKKLLCFS